MYFYDHIIDINTVEQIARGDGNLYGVMGNCGKDCESWDLHKWVGAVVRHWLAFFLLPWGIFQKKWDYCVSVCSLEYVSVMPEDWGEVRYRSRLGTLSAAVSAGMTSIISARLHDQHEQGGNQHHTVPTVTTNVILARLCTSAGEDVLLHYTDEYILT